VRFALRPGLPAPARNRVILEFIGEIEAAGLQFGGGGPERVEGFAARGDRGLLSEEQRTRIRDWLAGHPEIVTSEVGPRVDAYYSPPD
jgi:uncharacterized protein YggL (DUF469 family)